MYIVAEYVVEYVLLWNTHVQILRYINYFFAIYDTFSFQLYPRFTLHNRQCFRHSGFIGGGNCCPCRHSVWYRVFSVSTFMSKDALRRDSSTIRHFEIKFRKYEKYIRFFSACINFSLYLREYLSHEKCNRVKDQCRLCNILLLFNELLLLNKTI